jgi:hypothetical protein
MAASELKATAEALTRKSGQLVLAALGMEALSDDEHASNLAILAQDVDDLANAVNEAV